MGRGARPGRGPAPRRCAGRDGPDSVAVFGGGGLTNEKAYQLGKLARVALGTSQIDYNGRWCMSSAASAGNRAFGIDRGLPFPLADVEQTDVVVLVGSNLAETMPPAARHLDRLRERGGRVVVIDPRRTPTAERADLFLQPVPGTDLALALGLLHLLDAAGAVDEEYVARAHHRLGRRTPRGRGLVARAGRAGLRRPGRRAARAGRAARRRRPGHGAHRARCRAARPGHRDGAGLDRRRARARAARRAVLRIRLPHRPGQRPGRPRARAEGRPAARLPDDRRPGRARPRRRRVGRRPGRRCPGRGARRTSCSTRSARRRPAGAAGLRQQHRGLRSRTRRTSPTGWRRSTCWSSPTS